MILVVRTVQNLVNIECAFLAKLFLNECSKMTILIVSDIFGITPALKLFSEKLKGLSHDVRILDPYKSIEQNFVHEAQAYEYFINNVGLDAYTNSLALFINSYLTTSDKNIVIGFSVGASAIWQISASESFKCIKHFYCFYGSQIRKLTHIQPMTPCTVIFPQEELHFNIDKL